MTETKTKISLDETDYQLLRALQRDASVSMEYLAQTVGASKTVKAAKGAVRFW